MQRIATDALFYMSSLKIESILDIRRKQAPINNEMVETM